MAANRYTREQILDALRRRERKPWGDFPELGVETIQGLLSELQARETSAPDPLDVLAGRLEELLGKRDLDGAKALLDRIGAVGRKAAADFKNAVKAAEDELERARKASSDEVKG